LRDGSPLDVPLVQFAWDKEKSMHVYIGDKPKEEKDKRKERELSSVARDIFNNTRQCTYSELCEQIQAILDVKERAAKNYIKFMREKNIVVRDTSDTSNFILGNI